MAMATMDSQWTYLTQEQAVAVDFELMSTLGFSIDQLMELAGLSVACALAAEFPAATHGRVLVLAGPGNNGGDGLVAARCVLSALSRCGLCPLTSTHLVVGLGLVCKSGPKPLPSSMRRHLHHFGYAPVLCYPKPTDRPLYNGLVVQCRSLDIPFVSVEQVLDSPLTERYDVVLDALFGFSFKVTPGLRLGEPRHARPHPTLTHKRLAARLQGQPRAPFDQLLRALLPAASPPPIVSVDIPSGWQASCPYPPPSVRK
jgi:NAD(P)H-hydrate repair Nnr-like enzyme with NAD(P)H-hydrate epimerase domain